MTTEADLLKHTGGFEYPQLKIRTVALDTGPRRFDSGGDTHGGRERVQGERMQGMMLDDRMNAVGNVMCTVPPFVGLSRAVLVGACRGAEFLSGLG